MKLSAYNGDVTRNRVSDSNQNVGISLPLYVNDQDTFSHARNHAHTDGHNCIHVYDEIG